MSHPPLVPLRDIPAGLRVYALEHRALRRDAIRLEQVLAGADVVAGRSLPYEIVTALPRWFAFVSSCAGAHQRSEDAQLLPRLAAGCSADVRCHEQLLAEHDVNDATAHRVEDALRELADATGDRWVAALTHARAEAATWRRQLEWHLEGEELTFLGPEIRDWAETEVLPRVLDPLATAWVLDGIDADDRASVRSSLPLLDAVLIDDVAHRYARLVRPVVAELPGPVLV